MLNHDRVDRELKIYSPRAIVAIIKRKISLIQRMWTLAPAIYAELRIHSTTTTADESALWYVLVVDSLRRRS